MQGLPLKKELLFFEIEIEGGKVAMKDELKVLIQTDVLQSLYEFRELNKPDKSLSIVVEDALIFYLMERGIPLRKTDDKRDLKC
jgi:hypothetical protein